MHVFRAASIFMDLKSQVPIPCMIWGPCYLFLQVGVSNLESWGPNSYHNYAIYNLLFTAITTIEGVLKRTIMGLAQDQPVRRLMDPEGAKQIDDYVAKIESLLTLKEPFHVVRSLIFIHIESNLKQKRNWLVICLSNFHEKFFWPFAF